MLAWFHVLGDPTQHIVGFRKYCPSLRKVHACNVHIGNATYAGVTIDGHQGHPVVLL
jgi:hypothetical protein